MPSAIERAVAQFDRALERREQAAIAQMLATWAGAWQRVRAQSETLARRIAAGEANQIGLTTRQRWLEDYQRMIEAELRKLIEIAEPATYALQQEAVDAALRDAVHLTGLAAGENGPAVVAMLRRPNEGAVRALVGAAGDGSPLRTLLDGIASGRGEAMAQTLARGVADGLGPRVIARQLRSEFAAPAYRAVLIARTETQRAYRTATMETYRANDDIIDGWVWMAALSDRTCAACWMMHGTFHRLSETLQEHPGGRCKAIPHVKNVELNITPGPERLAAASTDTQLRVLGSGKFLAWQGGQIQLEDIPGKRRSREWGTTIRVRPLSALIAHGVQNESV